MLESIRRCLFVACRAAAGGARAWPGAQAVMRNSPAEHRGRTAGRRDDRIQVLGFPLDRIWPRVTAVAVPAAVVAEHGEPAGQADRYAGHDRIGPAPQT